MAVTLYYGEDASAPLISRAPGKLIEVFDACLVNGYGAKPAAGWTKEFSGTNKAVYRASVGNQIYLRVDDTNEYYTVITPYESMTDVDTGTGDFTYGSSNVFFKSNRSSDTADPWILVADERGFYWLPMDSFSLYGFFYFGDFININPNFNYNTILVAAGAGLSLGTQETESLSNDQDWSRPHQYSSDGSKYLWRDFTGLLYDTRDIEFVTQFITNDRLNFGTQDITYPNPINGGLFMSRMGIRTRGTMNVANSMYGYVPGLFNPMHTRAFGTVTSQFTGVEGYTGIDFLYVPLNWNNSSIILQISDDWYA